MKGKKEKSLTRYYDADKDIIDYEAIKKIKKDLTKNNFLNTSYGFFEPGTEWHTLASTTGSLAEEKIKTIDLIFEEQSNGKDIILGMPFRFGIGYGLPNESVPYLPDDKVCYWGGWGGSLVINDVERELSFAYMMNKMSDGTLGDPRGEGLVNAMYRAL